MPDPAQNPTLTDGPTLAVEPLAPAPATPQVSPAPVAATAVASAAPVSAPSSEAGAVLTPEALQHPADIPSLIEGLTLDGKPPSETKPGEPDKKQPEAEAKPDDAPKPSEAEAKPPVSEAVDYFKDVTVPETVKIEDAQRGELNNAFDALRSGDTKGGVQKLLDLHNQTVNQIVEDLTRKQYETFTDTRKTWAAQIKADEELGGAGHETAMKVVARMRDMLVPERDRAEFNDFMRITGAGDHPAFARILYRAGRFFDEPAMAPPNPKPPANIGKPPGRRGNAADLYPNTNFAK